MEDLSKVINNSPVDSHISHSKRFLNSYPINSGKEKAVFICKTLPFHCRNRTNSERNSLLERKGGNLNFYNGFFRKLFKTPSETSKVE